MHLFLALLASLPLSIASPAHHVKDLDIRAETIKPCTPLANVVQEHPELFDAKTHDFTLPTNCIANSKIGPVGISDKIPRHTDCVQNRDYDTPDMCFARNSVHFDVAIVNICVNDFCLPLEKGDGFNNVECC
ncbi:hypothetical protein K491DRAFT_726747 [Lophiostoma macrostomum CBS 122681]|uniref:Uncharacterized protein n=1 Tax=Lophiostoma macrostomum CBS 122681 TaxID=1314788 RepID=A0A6A6SY11_9PLEO|nr:hypothetical protein K491DRAFT_726747 [Lophiostoma macrostomum CBS 122681]